MGRVSGFPAAAALEHKRCLRSYERGAASAAASAALPALRCLRGWIADVDPRCPAQLSYITRSFVDCKGLHGGCRGVPGGAMEVTEQTIYK